jgi:hypothetical protein
MEIFVLSHENLFARSEMDDSVVVGLLTFTTFDKAKEAAEQMANEFGLVPSGKTNTWYDPEEGAELISITEVELQ